MLRGARGNTEEDFMGLITLARRLAVVIGWLASIIMRTDAQQGVLMNIVVGVS
jgi:uncharacterized membrane protein YeaQ/YmgE (transglycosylase-associated protein family)